MRRAQLVAALRARLDAFDRVPEPELTFIALVELEVWLDRYLNSVHTRLITKAIRANAMRAFDAGQAER